MTAASSTDSDKERQQEAPRRTWRSFFARNTIDVHSTENDTIGEERPTKWSLGVLNDKITHEVPGTYSFRLHV
jgi:hypothetical protein